MTFKESLDKSIIYFDGAMGSVLQKQGLGQGVHPETLNITEPERVKAVHLAYLASGANVITTNTFGASPIKFGDGYEDVVKAAVKIARNAVEDNKSGYVALDLGPTGKLLAPLGELAFEDCVENYKAVVSLVKDKIDLVLVETMSDIYEIKAAILAIKEVAPNLPFIVTFTIDKEGRLLTGADVVTAVTLIESLGATAVGLNCGFGAQTMLSKIDELYNNAGIPIIIQPNAGLPKIVNGETIYDTNEEEFAEIMLEIANKGARILGGCCGTTPDYIRAVVNKTRNVEPKEIAYKNVTRVTSYTHTVEFAVKPIIIGERLNPTGKKVLKEALKAHDLDYVYREGLNQVEKGAEILDVNVGVPGLNEEELMVEVIEGLQAVTDVPLQIDTTNIDAMESALRIYNGRPLINSVNGKKESMDSIFPLAKKYGAVVVALTLDEDGIPSTANGRIAIAKRIVDTAEKYGIPKCDLIFDTLAMTISTGENNAKVAIDALDYIKNEMGINTSLGVSNISFGLPNRDIINSTFFTMALQKGLSAGIINPFSEPMMNAYDAYLALTGIDKKSLNYIAKHSIVESPVVATTKKEIGLKTAIVSGLQRDAKEQCEALIKTLLPLDIINEYIVPALDEVGNNYEKGKSFLPQLLMSADAAQVAFEVIKNALPNDKKTNKSNRIILATVKGDVHDIGKNIVKVLLQNYGYDVIDLGKDVKSETVLEAVKKYNASLVGLSALMTTTVSSMEETIKLLRLNTNVKIVVGGAVLTEEYAEEIDADFYAKDAMATVRYAQKHFEKG